MLLLFPQWQFANQAFQYQFAKHYAKNDEIILTTSSQYFSIIDESKDWRFKFFFWKKDLKYSNFWCFKISRMLAKLRIISHLKPKYEFYDKYRIEKKWYLIKKGLLSKITFIDGFFINNYEYLKRRISIQKRYVLDAIKYLENIYSKFGKVVFVHVRRWDYLWRWVLWDKWCNLPKEYFEEQIKFFEKKYNSIAFLFLSDDIKRCKENFKWKNYFFSENMIWTDFAIMTLCDWWILSASSLSYFGAIHCKKTVEIIAPKYFNWFKKKIWYPNDIKNNIFIRK